MAKGRLKVYRALMGFAETVVAAPNQKAALDAWGARQNLFGEGLASVAEDPAAVAAALERPGEVLQRAVGSDAPFRAGPAEPPAVPAAKRPARKAAAPSKALPAPPAPPLRPKPDRSALDQAEAALKALDDEALAAEAELARRRAALEVEAAELARDLDRRRREATRRLQAARTAYQKAGGEAAQQRAAQP